MNPCRILRFLVEIAVIALAQPAHTAPGDLDSLDAKVAGAEVLVMVAQPDGKTIIAGTFSSVNGVARNNVARLNPDGSLDQDFDPNVNDTVSCAAVQSDGKILIGGVFTELTPNGSTEPAGRNKLARLNADGSLDMGFDPNPVHTSLGGGSINSVVIQTDGKILLGGFFLQLRAGTPTSFTTCGCVARLNADGTRSKNAYV